MEDKGSRKGEPKGKFPLELLYTGVTATNEGDGRPIYFSYNLGRCRDATPGGSCPKGLHICTLLK